MSTRPSFSHAFGRALRGEPYRVVGADGSVQDLPVGSWTRDPDAADEALLDLCRGATLDVGCGPGRLCAALSERGQVSLGIDVVGEAVRLTRDRGASALRRDVFGSLPGEGRWRTALLADGNVGIGGDPVALLRRVREVLDPRGRVVVELAPAGTPSGTSWAALEPASGLAAARSKPFRWSVVSVDDVGALATGAGLAVHEQVEVGPGRPVAVLGEVVVPSGSSW
ncbi:MAG: SAM-dependent methyltransferase [Nocardioides sp.]|nr:SAM-dependent methyltransferase [Nocardioides sp.]